MSHSLPPKSERSSKAPDLPEALAAALDRVRGDAANVDAWEDLSEVCREFDRPDEAAALFTEVLARGLEGEDLEQVGRCAADFCEEWYEDTGPVLEMLGRVLELDPTQQWAFDRLTVLLTASAQWEDLLAAYETAIAAADSDSVRQALYEEAAKVARDFAGEQERASDYLKQLLLLRLGDDQLAASTERRFDEQGRHHDLIEIWTARLDVLEGEANHATRLQIAARHLDALGDAAASLEAIDAFLESEGDAARAAQILERLSLREDVEVDARRAALARLAELYGGNGTELQLIDVIERTLLLATSVDEKVGLHRQVLELYLEQVNLDAALSHCLAVLALEPGERELRSRAREIADRMEQLSRYAQGLIQAADAAAEGKARIDLLVEAAQLSSERLDQGDGAIQLYQRILADEEADEPARLLACERLALLLEASQRLEELLVILERWADLSQKHEERRRILGQAAYLATELEQLERSLGLWSACLQDDPSDDEALTSKIDLYLQLDRPSGLVEVLLARSAVGANKDRQREDLVLAASVYSDRLADLASALSTWRQVEERFGRNEESVDALIRLSQQAEEHDQVVVLLQESIEATSDVERAVSQLSQLGDTYRLHLEQREDALDAYVRSLEHAPGDPTSRTGLRALMLDAELAHRAGNALADAMVRAEDWSEVVGLVEQRLQSAPGPDEQSAILIDAAVIRERQGDAASALAFVQRSFIVVPASATEQQLLRLAEETGDWAAASDGYARAIEASRPETDPERLARLHGARGQLEEERLMQLDAATDCYRAAVELNPRHEQNAVRLVRVAERAGRFGDAGWAVVEFCRARDEAVPGLLGFFAEQVDEHGDWNGAIEGLADKIATAEGLSAGVAHDLKTQLATWYRDRLSDPDSAEMVLKRAVADHPKEHSLRMLADLQRRTPGRPLVQTLVLLADQVGDDLAVLREAGEVALSAARDPELAEPILSRALAAAKERFEQAGDVTSGEGFESSDVCAWATDHLVELALTVEQPETAVRLLEESARLPFDSREKVVRRFRAARVAAEGGLDDEAVRLCEEVLASENNHDGAIALLGELHESAGRLEELLELRGRELGLERPLERRLFLRLDQARVLGALEREPELRVQALRANLEDSPGHHETVVALSELLESRENFADLVSLLEEQAQVVVGAHPERAAELFERAGSLALDRLEDEERLAVNYKKAAAARPTPAVVDRLAAMAQAAESGDEEVTWLTILLELTPSLEQAPDQIEARRDVVQRLGAALIKTEESDAARKVLEQELATDAAADGERRLLAEIYRRQEEWALLAELLAEGVPFVEEGAEQVEYLREAADVRARRLGELELAAALLSEASNLAPDDRSLKVSLADVLRTSERYEEAARLLHELLEEFGRRRTKERAVVHQQLAQIARAAGDLDEALAQAESAANIERTDPAILMLVGQLARAKGLLDRAEQAYRTLALIASRASGQSADDAVGESEVLFELYRISNEKGDDAQAKELLDSALEVATRDLGEAMKLAQALRVSGQIDLLLEALTARLDGSLHGVSAARLLITKAAVLEGEQRVEEALDMRMQALSETPSDLRLLESTQKLAEKVGTLDSFWRHVIRLADQAGQAGLERQLVGELLYRAGKAYEEPLGDVAQASALYEKSLATGHKSKRAFVALDRVLDPQTEGERLRSALARFVESKAAESAPQLRADSLYRLAAFELEGGEYDVAAKHLMEALELDPQPARVVELLQPTIESGVESGRLVILFLSVCRKAASEETLLYAFKKAVLTQTVEFSVVEEAIALARQLDDADGLRTLLSRAIELREEELGEIKNLIVERAAMARNDGDYQLEATLLERVLPEFEGDDGFELQLRYANCIALDLGRTEQGLAAFEKLFEQAPLEGRVWRTLLTLHRAQGNNQRIEEVIELIADDVTDSTDLEALKLERVRLMMGDGRNEEAEAELRSTLQEHPQMSEAASLLADILRQSERNEELAVLLQELLDQASAREDGELVAKFGMELAGLKSPEERQDAIAILIRGIELTKDNPELLQYLLSLYTEEDNQSERADVMEYLLAQRTGGEARALCDELIALRQSLGDDYGATRALEVGVRQLPDDVELVERLMDQLRAQGEHGPLADALMVRGAQLSGNDAALRFADAGQLYDEFLGDPTKAAEAFEAAYSADPGDATMMRRALELRLNLGEVDTALKRLQTAIETADDMNLADLLQQRADVLLREKLGDVEGMKQAASDLALALEQLLPEEQERELQQMRIGVLTELRSLHQSSDDAASEREAVVELAAAFESSDDAPAALDVLASWLRDHEDDAQMAKDLGSRALERQDAGTAVFAYQRLFDAVDDSEKPGAALLLAEAARAFGSLDEARVALEQAFAIDPADVRVFELLKSSYEESGAFEELASIIEAQVDSQENDEDRSQLLLQVGELRLQGGDPRGALEAFQKARPLTENSSLIVAKLAEVHIAENEIVEARALLDQAIEEHGRRRSPELALLQRGLAQVEEAEGNIDGMFSWLEAALMSDRNNVDVARELAVRGQETGRFDIAIKALQNLTLSKVEGGMSKAEAYFRQAQIAQVQGDSKKALLMARRAHAADNDLPGLDDLLAELGG